MLGTENLTRRDWMRKAADLLVQRGQKEDLERVRKALDEDHMDPSQTDIPYLAARGQWEDVKRIQKIQGDYRSTGLRTTLLTHKPPTLAAANAILKLAGNRIIDVLKLELPGELLAAVIYQITRSKFAKLPEEVLIAAMNHEQDIVRKITALKIIESLNVSRAQQLAEIYAKQSYLYYNVIRWLDLSYGFGSIEAKRAAARELTSVASRWSQ